MEKGKKMTATEAVLQGYEIDRTCYPNVAFMGPRFYPTNFRVVITELEEKLLEALQVAKEAIEAEVGPSLALREAYHIIEQAIRRAKC